MDAPARLRVSCLVMLQVKVTEGVSGHAADFLQRTATGPSCGKSIHVPHLRALRGCSLFSSKLLKSRKSAACPEPPRPETSSVTLVSVWLRYLLLPLLLRVARKLILRITARVWCGLVGSFMKYEYNSTWNSSWSIVLNCYMCGCLFHLMYMTTAIV